MKILNRGKAEIFLASSYDLIRMSVKFNRKVLCGFADFMKSGLNNEAYYNNNVPINV